MPTYLSPGVYMEEVSSGSKPIEGVGTAVAAFVGFAEKGPVNEPTLVTNWTQFTHAVYGYFLNGEARPTSVHRRDGDGPPMAPNCPPATPASPVGQALAQEPKVTTSLSKWLTIRADRGHQARRQEGRPRGGVLRQRDDQAGSLNNVITR
jgi:hypothetical protein